MVDLKRRKGESFEALFRRFSRRVQQSGRLIEARKIRFNVPKPSKNRTRDSALRRLEMRDKREYLIKAGKLVEEDRSQRRGGNRR